MDEKSLIVEQKTWKRLHFVIRIDIMKEKQEVFK